MTRCPRCDRPEATLAQWNAHDDVPGVCFDTSCCPPVDWRARALAAEEALLFYAAASSWDRGQYARKVLGL